MTRRKYFNASSNDLPMLPRHIVQGAIRSYTFTDVCEQAISGMRHNTQRAYRKEFTLWREFCTRSGILYFDVSAYYVSLFAATRPGESSRAQALAALRALCIQLFASTGSPEYMGQHGYLKAINPNERPAPRQARQPKTALDETQSRAMIAVWAGKNTAIALRNRALIATMLYTGLRRFEVVALRWDAVDWTEQTISVDELKGGESGIVGMVDGDLDDILREWYQVAQLSETPYLFPHIWKGGTITHDRISDRAAWNIVRQAGKEIGIDDLSPHDLRRTMTTMAFTKGGDLKEIREQLNHKSIGVTETYYLGGTGRRIRINGLYKRKIGGN